MQQLQPDAILTKESGVSGYFLEKVCAAQRFNIPVFVVKRPVLPDGFYQVTGPHGLRHRVERLLPAFFPCIAVIPREVVPVRRRKLLC